MTLDLGMSVVFCGTWFVEMTVISGWTEVYDWTEISFYFLYQNLLSHGLKKALIDVGKYAPD